MVVYMIDAYILTKDKKAIIKRFDVDDPNFDWEYGDHTYKIREGALFEKRSRIPHLNLIYDLMRWRFYWIVFIEGLNTPLVAGNPKFSPQEIWLINSSTILGKALRGLISKGLNNRMLIIIIFVLLIVLYYIFTGGLTL